MPVESAFGFLSALADSKRLADVMLVAGPHAFLREYVLDAVTSRLVGEGFAVRAFQVANALEAGAVAEEIKACDLFCPKRVIVCRVTRSYRERTVEDGPQAERGRGPAGASEAALAGAIADCRPPNHLVIVFERDNAPAKIRQAAARAGVTINCARPFDNQLTRYAALFARRLELRLSQSVAETVVSRHGGDLAAIANALAKAAIRLEPGASLETADLTEPGGARVPELFEIAQSVSSGRSASALSELSRAIAAGRDPVEILSVEVVPALRRMAVAAAMIAAKSKAPDIAAALGFAPASAIAARAIDGARRLGVQRLDAALRRAAELDADFKSGRIKERAEALAGLILELAAS